MADVIPFVQRRRFQAAPGAGEATGQILFFTGIRYERQPEPAVPSSEKPVRRHKRVGTGTRVARNRRPG